MRNHRQEKVLSAGNPHNGSAQVRRLRVWMYLLLIAVLVLAVVLGTLTWRMFSSGQSAGQVASSAAAATVSGETVPLPVPNDTWALTIVSPDKKLSSTFQPQLVGFETVQVDKRILPALTQMFADAKAAGCPLQIVTGYVDANTQQKLYQQKVQELMQKEGKTRAVAESDAMALVPPGGCSEDQTGMAVTVPSDAKFLASDAYHWLLNHCVEYGFIRRYTDSKEGPTGLKDNPSHFRYVGTANAQSMRRLGMCLEEYVVYKNSQTSTS